VTRQIKRGDGFITERPQRDGSTRYQARWNDGTRWRARTFPTQDEAEDHLRTIGRAKRSGRYTPDDGLTFLQSVDDYLARGRSRWRESTYRSYLTIRDRVIDTPIGTRRLTELTPRTMQYWIDDLSRTFAPARVEVIRAVASGALKEAMRLGVITSNPLSGVRMPRHRHWTSTTWTSAHVATVLAAVQDDPLMYLYYVVALSTGMRPGEIRALKWGDIDLDRAVLTCQRSMTRDVNYTQVIGTTTKTGRARTIALPDTAVTALRTHRREQAERRLARSTWHDADLVFDRGDGAPIPQQTIWRRHKDAVEQAGVPWCRLHDLRHTAATLLLEAGVSVKVISEMLGHSKIGITLDLYVSVSLDMQRRAADALGAVLDIKRA
jgi:integrase